jgi:chromosomal replication initiator protein
MDNTPDACWQRFLASIAPGVSKHVMDTWLRPLHCVSLDENAVTLQVRDRFACDWLNDHYLDFLRDGFSEFLGRRLALEWQINPALPDVASATETPEPSVSDSAVRPTSTRRFLNPRYMFNSFVAGPSNQFALAACRAVAENPGHSYNPLFLFGGVGLGKTHLIHAIGHHILKTAPDKRVIYTSSEQFMNEVVNAVRFSRLEVFHNKYRRNCDVILIDDIQLLAGKERTQHEFFHIFNTLHESQRQIVVTSDKLPHEIPEIEDRLRNRFQWGLIADIQPPEIETRIAILHKKAESEGIRVSDDVAYFLAEHVRSNVRELEGALVRLLAHASLTGTEITVEYARNILTDVLAYKAQPITVESIQKTVASHFNLRVLDLKSTRRQKILVRPRQIAMYLCRKHINASYPELGSRFGNKDHTTILSACRKIERDLKIDVSLRTQVHELERALDVHSN